MAWLQFAVCFFFGWLGIHKYMERKPGMGLLYMLTFGLLGVGWIYDTVRYLTAAVHGQRPLDKFGKPKPVSRQPYQRTLPDDAPLPVCPANFLILAPGEVCHYSGSAAAFQVKNRVVGYQGGSSGFSVRVMKGLYYRTGSSRGTPIRQDVAEQVQGALSVTSQRVIFSAQKLSFDKKLSALSSIVPHSDGLEFQFGTQYYAILTDEPQYVHQIILRAANPQDSGMVPS